MEYAGKDNLEVMEGAKNYNSYLLSLLEKNISAHDRIILDFGAGTGIYAKRVQKNNPKITVVALEPAENLDDCYAHGNISKIASLTQVKDIDLLYSFNVLEHICDDVEVLRQMHTALRKGGKLCLFVPAFPHLYSAMDKKVGHYRRYQKQELINKVTTAGFRVTDCRYKDFMGYFATIAYKLARNSSGQLNEKALSFYDKLVMPVSIVLDKLTKGKILGKNLWLEAEK